MKSNIITSIVIALASTSFCTWCCTYAYNHEMWYELFTTIGGYFGILIICHLLYTYKSFMEDEEEEEDFYE